MIVFSIADSDSGVMKGCSAWQAVFVAWMVIELPSPVDSIVTATKSKIIIIGAALSNMCTLLDEAWPFSSKLSYPSQPHTALHRFTQF